MPLPNVGFIAYFFSGHEDDSLSWLVGQPTTAITGLKLPSCEDVPRGFFNLHKEQKETTGASTAAAAKDVQKFWIQTIDETCISRKILTLFNERKLLGKNKVNPRSVPNQKKRHSKKGFLTFFFTLPKWKSSP